MATKRLGDSCYNKAGIDEPIFTLRAQDRLAHQTVQYWAALAEIAGVPKEKVADARKLALDMLEWAAENGEKVPD